MSFLLMRARVSLCASILLSVVGQSLADPIRIMPLGDSNTGIDPALFPGVPADHPAFQDLNKYREPLADLLAGDGYAVDFVGTQNTGMPPLADWDHEGHGGYRSDQMLNGFDGNGVGGIDDWLDQLIGAGQSPDVVLLMIGTNDILQGAAYRSALPDNLGLLIDVLAVRLPGVPVIVGSIPPLTFSPQKWNDYVVEFNAQIPGIVAARQAQGKNVLFADIYASLTFDDIAADSIHMTTAGFDKAAGVWHEAVVQVVPAPEPTTLVLLAVGGLVPLVLRASRRRQ